MFYHIGIAQLEISPLKPDSNTTPNNSNTISSPSSIVFQFKPSLLDINWFHRIRLQSAVRPLFPFWAK